MKIKKIYNLLFIFFAFSSCSLAPKYNRPDAPVPLIASHSPSKKKISIISWQEFFQSSDLNRVIRLALDNNRDLKIANLNIELAQQTYGVARSNLLPTINASGSQTTQGVPSAFAGFTPRKQYRANLALAAYEVDFFGRLRNLKKTAFEDYLATEQARNVTQIALISQTANTYAQLLLDSQILEIAQENMLVQSDRYKFSEKRYKQGIDSQDDLLNAQALIEGAKLSVANYQKLVEQDEHLLMLLAGSFDRKILPQDSNLDKIAINENLLDFVSSESLLSRPDIQQAEHNLKGANANIGAARAAFFPSITLTGTYGYGSADLSSLLDSKTWVFTPQINLPIFTGGRNMANLKLANLRKQVEVVAYEKAIQTAFSESLDQLAERKSLVKQLKSYDKILQAKQKSYDISEFKHKKGINSALAVLDAKLAMLAAKQNQLVSKKEYIANLVTLYKVLGGGSKVEVFEK